MQLAQYLPEDTYEPVMAYLHHYKVHLTIARSRNSVLGDYRHKHGSDHHRISVNGNLNKFAFLITLLHELAHLITFENFSNQVLAHGREWKQAYKNLLSQFIEKKVFPDDIEKELKKSLHKPGASTCAEEGLQRILYRYDNKKQDHFLIEQLQPNDVFKTRDNRRFQVIKKRLKRYECLEIETGKTFLFSPVYEVQKIAD